MADVTISSLTQGTPAGNNILPYSTGLNTLGVPVSAIFQNTSNVGIGIDNPVRRLEVNGAIKSYSAGGNLIFNSDSGYEWWTGSWNDFVSYQVTRRKNSDGEGTSHLTINTLGNVGIGTITPSTKLDVNGTIKATGLQVPGTVIQTVCLNNAGAGFHSQFISSGKGATFNTLTITPRFSSSKIVIHTGTAMSRVAGATTDSYTIKLRRGPLEAGFVQDAAPTLCILADRATYATNNSQRDSYHVTYLDSPSATSATTYSLYVSAVSQSAPTNYAMFNVGNCGYMMLQEIAQ